MGYGIDLNQMHGTTMKNQTGITMKRHPYPLLKREIRHGGSTTKKENKKNIKTD